MLWNRKERAASTGTSPPVRKDRSRAIRSASPSSAHTTTTGRPLSCPRQAAKWARWTADSPDRATGQRPLSMAASSWPNSGTLFKMSFKSFIAATK